MMRSLPVLLLSLVLGLASVSMAVVRAEMRGAETIVICAGSGTERLLVDARGNPVGSDHHCPDCLAGMAFALLPELPPHPGPPDQGQRLESPRPVLFASRHGRAAQARGPPPQA